MSRRILIFTFGLMVTIVSASAVDAGWREFHHRATLDWHRNNAWPQPWIHMDRVSTCQIFDIMAQNGWSQQSTLTSYHFHPTTQQLTEAGKSKVYQILRQHPESFRTMFVVTSPDDEITATRLDSVQKVAATLVPEGMLPDIRRVNIQPRGWPAAETNAIGMKFEQSIPAPRLPNMQGSMTTN